LQSERVRVVFLVAAGFRAVNNASARRGAGAKRLRRRLPFLRQRVFLVLTFARHRTCGFRKAPQHAPHRAVRSGGKMVLPLRKHFQEVAWNLRVVHGQVLFVARFQAAGAGAFFVASVVPRKAHFL